MNTNTYIVNILMLFFTFNLVISNTSLSQDPDGIEFTPEEPRYLGSCLKIQWSGVKPYYCIGEEIELELSIEWVPNCDEDNSCYGSYYGLLYDGKSFFYTIKQEQLKSNKSYKLKRHYNTSGDVDITFKLWKYCYFWGNELIDESTLTLHIVKPGDTYPVYKYEGIHFTDPDCDAIAKTQNDKVKLMACCGNTKSITVKSSLSKSNSHSNSYSFNLGISLSAGGILNTNFGIQETFKVETSQSLEYSFNRTYTYGNINGCEYPGLFYSYKLFKKLTYIAQCDPVKKDKLISSKYIKIPQEFYFAKCPLLLKEHVFYPPNIHHRNRLFASCNYDIIITFPPEANTEGYSYEWTTPSGDKLYTKDILATEYGLYTLVITDRYCKKHTYTYNLCKEVEAGEWVWNEDKSQYCRHINCKGDAPSLFSDGCGGSEYEECVTPEYGDWYFNEEDEKCYREVILNGKSIPELREEKDPEIIEKYDESLEKCVRKYYCTDEGEFGDPDFYNEEDPTNGEWEYDEDEEDCFAKLFCFDSDDPEDDVVRTDSEIEWDFDEFNGTCIGTVYCDGEETDFEIEGEPDLQDVDYDEFDEECISNEVYCNGELVPSAEYHFAPYSIGEWDENCDRIIICQIGGEEFIEKGDPFWTPIEDPLNECDEGETLYAVSCNGDPTEHEICFADDPNLAFKSYDHIKSNDFDIKVSRKDIKVLANLGTAPENIRILIYDYLGRCLYTEMAQIHHDKYLFNINISRRIKYPNKIGVYYIVLMGNGHVLYNKIMQL